MFDKKKWAKDWAKNNPEKIRKASLKYYYNHQEERLLYRSKKVKEKRQYIQDYKLSKGCSICGYNKCASALDFHHENNDKGFDIGKIIGGDPSFEKLKVEMDKCTVLCSNCHRELHESLRKLELE